MRSCRRGSWNFARRFETWNLDRSLRDVEPLGDLLVRKVVEERPQHFALSAGDRRRQPGLRPAGKCATLSHPQSHEQHQDAKSRRPVALRRSQLASSSRTWAGSSDRGNPASRQVATEGTAVASGCVSSPSICRKLSSERSAVTISFADPRRRLRHSASTKFVTSLDVNPER